VKGFVRSSVSFTEQPKVIDGASDLLTEVFGERGRHARTATGVAQLPFGASVQLDIIFQVNVEKHHYFWKQREWICERCEFLLKTWPSQRINIRIACRMVIYAKGIFVYKQVSGNFSRIQKL
jgi:hypothetical protein